MNVWDKCWTIINYSIVEWEIECIKKWPWWLMYDISVNDYIYTNISEYEVSKDRSLLKESIENKIKELKSFLEKIDTNETKSS